MENIFMGRNFLGEINFLCKVAKFFRAENLEILLQ
jgi:hypothetical protein